MSSIDQDEFRQAIRRLKDDHFMEILRPDATPDKALCVYEYLEILNLALWADRKNQVALITPAMRPETVIFWSVLEHNYFPPRTDRNQEFHFLFARHQGMIFNVGVVPVREHGTLDLVADQTNMTIRHQPTFMVLGGKHVVFPVAGPNVFWLENRPAGQLHYKAGEHALKNFIDGKYTLDQMFAEVRDAELVSFKQEVEKVRAFWRQKGVPDIEE